MFNNIVVGVDGHHGGRDAVALAKKLRAIDGQLTLAHVYAGEPYPWHEPASSNELGKLERIEELLEGAAEEAGVDAALRWRSATSVGRGLHELCELIEADLLVVGTSRHGLLGRVLMRDDTHAALNGAPCAIAIAPGGYALRQRGLINVGVGYDGSAESTRAFAIAKVVASEHQGHLSVLSVVSSPGFSYTADESVDSVIAERLSDARERMADLDGAEPHAVYGAPADELALYSASVDLLVLGSRGYGPLGRLMHGSVSQQLARSARCPLLILTRAATIEPEQVAGEQELAGAPVMDRR